MEEQPVVRAQSRKKREGQSATASSYADGRPRKYTLEMDGLLLQEYVIHQKIEKTVSFNCQFHRVTNKTEERVSTLKTEPLKFNPASQTLWAEYVILKKLQNVEGIPKILCFGNTPKLYFLEMQDFEQDLTQIPRFIRNDDNSLCDIAIDILQILQKIHKHNFIHRDIHPENIVFNNGQILLVGFGKACTRSPPEMLKNPKTFAYGSHHFVGSLRYASISAHRGKSADFFDDIESLLYTLIEFRGTTLPWVIFERDPQAIMKIGKTKKKTPRKQICQGLPICFLQTFEEIDNARNFRIDYQKIIDFFKYNRQPEPSASMKDCKRMVSFISQISSCQFGSENKYIFMQDSIDENPGQNISIEDLTLDLLVSQPEDDDDTESLVGEEFDQTSKPLSTRLSNMMNESPKFKASD